MLSKASTMPVSNSLFVLVVNELKEIGIKHKEKKPKIIKASVEHRLFRQGLQYLKLADAFLENGTVVQIPQFVVEACSFILEHCETEGIFRRAGSAIKQREIRKFLEAGNSLGKCHRVIDVANIVSYFFRELPEPLIPSYLHDTLVRCLLTPTTTSNTIHSMQLTCLIMPLLTVQTLAYFMQFLNTITRHVASNKMSAQNLAIVIAPSIMPYRDINSVRFKNHIKIVEMLINNASVIGNIPERIQDKLGSKSKNLLNTCLIATKKKRHECRRPLTTQMQRRSNIFSMLKTKVGLTMNSSPAKQSDTSNTQEFELSKETSKDKCGSEIIVKSQICAEPFDAFRSKQNELMNMNGNCENQPANKRRWSVVPTGFAKDNKNKNMIKNIQIQSGDYTKNCPHTCENEFDAVLERVSSIKSKSNTPKEKCFYNLESLVSEEICVKTELINTKIKTRRSSEGNFVRSLNLVGTARRTREHMSSRIYRHIPCNINVPSDSTPNFRSSKSQNLNTPSPGIIQKDFNQWLPAEHFFKNLDNCYTPVQEIGVHYDSKTQGFENLNKELYFTKKNITEKTIVKLKSSSKIIVEEQGRSSIARLRTENFGMVLARTKLFE
ncbi:uncharacterized protein LOC132797684 [Drosophila nasuta]|uniref:Uncharacterized protein LOC117573183 isoform X1 n=1 Tax=Drosophila albomicans TaxID=7291 RepID=A0A6P8Z643_DROAB|nr:uncharacterized protein LOC117573183 isoform X1 [Drosophila albomicans]XP_060665417.1 uncharacterized protein LOC132797684 [Drosophila nasuta]